MLERMNVLESVDLARGNMSCALDQPLLGYGVGGGMLNGLKDGGRVGKPVADAADDEGFKGNCRDSLALASGLGRPVQQ